MYRKIITDSIGSHVRCFIWKHNVDRTLKSSCLLSVRYQHYGKPPSFLSTYLHQYNFAVLDCYIVSSFFAFRLPPLNKEKAKRQRKKDLRDRISDTTALLTRPLTSCPPVRQNL